ncbi:uncharacterized protein LACBIDRAFT_247939 [Laccaria bicolor S238N-H82]|uniref:Predicted protein n=1 Tax=Laccaria bicolor (strain S238N-H82 / ATCC MYA-4686) TaxID=486041 RepID=B0D4K9_LACBS|nr:uncharacterized protein LACBIDRAFT_247939 [Laccaria bicolor S238N-H82]EDR10362.1 predicted protein [Laccaria bicolor S238N-H82]|eukprot:XP_001878812.1 predicted protein [Laccaria bicolor S238N-H82]
MHTVAIALGSNLGDRFRNIELALRLLEIPQQLLSSDGQEESDERGEVKAEEDSPLELTATVSVVNTSFLYETAPMYVTDQPSFINCACLVETNLPPTTMLRLLKKIEMIVGRVPSIRFGPRAVDLDLVLYDQQVLDTRELVIPHPRLVEREFVLRPLNDMIPDYIHPIHHKSLRSLLKKTLTYWTYPNTSHSSAPTHTGNSHGKLNVHHHPKHKSTYLMSTLNATPDSFSDGLTHNTLPTALSYARESVSAGAAIIDIGGYSTRPGAAFVGVQEEIDRVVPVVQAIRLAAAEESEKLRHVLISVDTFRWEVAEAAVRAGANCINDVYAFTGPEYFLERVAREYATPCVLMHSRGEAGQNKGYKAMYGYAGLRGAVVEGVRVELGQKVNAVVRGRGGVRRWLVVADPGVGFSKTVEGNLEVLRDAKGVCSGDKKYRNPLAGYPFLIGTSRKSYIGGVLAQGPGGRETVPTERVWATAAGVACAVQQGALVVRVHDTREMADVVRMADALWG